MKGIVESRINGDIYELQPTGKRTLAGRNFKFFPSTIFHTLMANAAHRLKLQDIQARIDLQKRDIELS
jgi:hypothetical protein